MALRLRVFASAFGAQFERILKEEITRIDFAGYYRQSGVLVARCLIGPTISAIYKSARLAFHTQPERALAAENIFRISGYPEVRSHDGPKQRWRILPTASSQQ